MADFGVRIRNGDLITQIDSTYKNLALWAKGVAVANQATGFVSWRAATVTVPYNSSSSFAWRADFPSFVMGATFTATTMTVTFLSYIVGGSQATITWYVFASPDVTGFPAGQDYGLRVKNANWAVSFDSRNQYMRYLASLSGTKADLPTTQDNLPPQFLTYAMPVGTLPAVLQGNLCSHTEEVPVGVGPNPGYMFFWIASCVRQLGNTLGIANAPRVQGPYNDPINAPLIDRPLWNYTVIDVNGL